jgi:hypothetical protein
MIVLHLRSIPRHRAHILYVFVAVKAATGGEPDTVPAFGPFLVDGHNILRDARGIRDSAVLRFRADCAFEGAGDVHFDLECSTEDIEAMRCIANLKQRTVRLEREVIDQSLRCEVPACFVCLL